MDSKTTLPDNSIILITGINGYIASHIAYHILAHHPNYMVRGTSRSSHHEAALRKTAFSAFPPDRYQHVLVPDITSPGAFDDAVTGVHSIIHVASPVDFSLKTVDAFFTPALRSITSILNSALTQPTIKSFVLTSSIAAVADRWRHGPPPPNGTYPPSGPHTYTESDWNTTGESVARQSEKDSPAAFLPMVAYGASKAAAERAMWRWAVEHDYPFAFSSICPGVTMGPPVYWPERPEGLNETLKPVWRIWSGECKAEGRLPGQIGGMAYVDVRDVACLHGYCAIEVGAQWEGMRENGVGDGTVVRVVREGGEIEVRARENRYLMVNGKGTWQAVADVLRERLTGEGRERIIEGQPGCDYVREGWMFPGTEPGALPAKACRAGGVEVGGFKKLDEIVMETVKAFEERWGVPQ